MNLEIDFIQAEKLLDKIYIDLRSPKEFEEDHLPNAINLPLFSDKEREIIGTKYCQENSQAAILQGIDFLAPKLKNIVLEIINLKKKYKYVIIYCWRGGMRSKILWNFLNSININVYRLIGGYKSYRKIIYDKLENELFENSCPIVIHGYSGIGKTKFLSALKEKGIPAINLEKLANHRGSIFGNLGLIEKSQKKFESDLYNEWLSLRNKKYFFIECESRKIGKINLPKTLFEKMKAGKQILLTANKQIRIKNIIEEYGNYWKTKDLEVILESLSSLISRKKYEKLMDFYHKNDLINFVDTLLTDYYDQHYNSYKKINFYKIIDISENFDENLNMLINIYNDLINNEG